MDYNYFKNKYIDELNIEELEWINQNGFLNYYVYYGQKYVLTHDKLKLDILKEKYPIIINKIYEYYNKLQSSFQIAYINKIFKYIHLLNQEIFYILDYFLENKELIKEYTSLYLIIRWIEHNLLKQSKFNQNIKFRLWSEYLVRDPQEKHHIFQRRAIPYAEIGDYKTALKKLKTSKLQVEELYNRSDIVFAEWGDPVMLSWWFYKLRLEYLSGNIDEHEKVFNFIKKNIELHSAYYNKHWSITVLKICELYLHYIETSNTNLHSKYVSWLKLVFKYYTNNKNVQFIPLDFKYAKIEYNYNTNIEIVREPILHMMYYLDIKKAAH